ncbi:hypothetical protein ATANTOWER_030696 [Ataeniobius toweri]|uniref:Uncharacterized protein n=1 Tax=Ataeniobius toweri TaxID=208326 RepID=A0ABU7CDP9_9TELE|nr:hypothetical protein [Ataeniobius toweri]
MDFGFVDCHCHISATEFQLAGVKTLVAVTEEVEEFPRVLQLQESYPDLVAPCFGLHPLQAGGGPAQRSVKPRAQMDSDIITLSLDVM